MALVAALFCINVVSAQGLPSSQLISWSNDRKLKKSDFKAEIAKSSQVAAASRISILASWSCSGDGFQYQITAVFDPNQSWWGGASRTNWTLPALNMSDSQLLEHEQTHFDIGEVVARELRSYFSHVQGACAKEGAIAPLQAVVMDFKQKLEDEEVNYDLETSYGREPRKQWEWTSRVRKQLRTGN